MVEGSDVFSSNVTGFVLYDPDADSTLYSLNGDKYFTPASNTKLFTFYTSLQILPDSLRALEYVVKGDSLIFWGTGDPSFLQADYGNSHVYNFLKNRSEKLFYSDANYADDVMGSGWAWDDYNSYYSAEKSPLPMYGNLVKFTLEDIQITQIQEKDGEPQVTPKVFRSKIKEDFSPKNERFELLRERTENQFSYQSVADTTTYTLLRPFHYTPELITEMLSDTLGKPVEYIDFEEPELVEVLHSIPADTVYKHMLQPSDNFIAEQLLLMDASELGKPLNTQDVIDVSKSEFLNDLPDEPQWVDGSGLSRYNMFTPRSIVRLLHLIDGEYATDEQLFDLLPTGGKTGTIDNWYANREGGDPYVHAKTGTLRNNHCLSGFLVTESGHKLIFSFMNNHYVTSSSVVKEEMEKVLWYIHKHY